MSKKMKKMKEEFLQDISKITDSQKEEIKNLIGIKNKQEQKEIVKKSPKRPIIFGSLCTAVCVIVALIIIVNLKTPSVDKPPVDNSPVYKGMYAEKIDNNVRQKQKLAGSLGNEIIDKIGVVTIPGISLYEKPNKTINIRIELENEKEFEIVSFTLNGVKYQSYQFKEGSNSTQIFVEFTTSSMSGIQEITIDAIKYIDGTDIKDARFDGEKTIKIGVTYQNIPSATVSENVIINSLNVDVNVVDIDKIINISNGLALYLYENETLVKTTKLKLGSNNIEYSDLKYDTTYTYVVIAIYDLLDGNGKRGYILYQNTINIVSPYVSKNITVGFDNAHIDLSTVDGFNGYIDEVNIYKNQQLISKIPGTLITNNNINIDNLLSNTEYTLVIVYKYTVLDQQLQNNYQVTFKTNAYDTPSVNFENVIATTTSVSFDYKVEGMIGVNILSIELKHNDEIIKTTLSTLLEFDNLLSNNDYIIVINYSYDLNDGNGLVKALNSISFHTKKMPDPTIVENMPLMTFGNITNISLLIDDSLKLIQSMKLQVQQNEQVIQEISCNLNDITIDEDGNLIYETTISNLDINNSKLIVVWEYTLNDGSPNYTSSYELPLLMEE